MKPETKATLSTWRYSCFSFCGLLPLNNQLKSTGHERVSLWVLNIHFQGDKKTSSLLWVAQYIKKTKMGVIICSQHCSLMPKIRIAFTWFAARGWRLLSRYCSISSKRLVACFTITLLMQNSERRRRYSYSLSKSFQSLGCGQNFFVPDINISFQGYLLRGIF